MGILSSAFLSDRSGNFGIMTALLMAPLVGAWMADLVLEGRDAIPAGFRAAP